MEEDDPCLKYKANSVVICLFVVRYLFVSLLKHAVTLARTM